MVEMLGTLAVMGILSVVGLWVYGTAMDSLKANNILNEVNKRAHTCIAQINLMGKECNLAEYPPKIDEKYTVTTAPIDADFFKIVVNDIPQDVCQQIKNKGFSLTGKIIPENCASTNEMIFVFDNNLERKSSPETCQNTTDCSGGCEQCVDGFCIEQCPQGKKCGRNLTASSAYGSKQKICCNVSNYVDGICAYRVENNQVCTSMSNIIVCCPSGYMRKANECISCDSDEVINYGSSFSAFCRLCSNRVLAGTSCVKSCPEGTTLDSQGNCACPSDKPLQSAFGECYPCLGYVRLPYASNLKYDCEKYCGETHFRGSDPDSCCPKDVSQLNSTECDRCGATWNGTSCQKNE